MPKFRPVAYVSGRRKALAYLRGQARVTLYFVPFRVKVNSRSSFTTLRSAIPISVSPFIIAVHI